MRRPIKLVLLVNGKSPRARLIDEGRQVSHDGKRVNLVISLLCLQARDLAALIGPDRQAVWSSQIFCEQRRAYVFSLLDAVPSLPDLFFLRGSEYLLCARYVCSLCPRSRPLAYVICIWQRPTHRLFVQGSVSLGSLESDGKVQGLLGSKLGGKASKSISEDTAASVSAARQLHIPMLDSARQFAIS